MLFHRHCASIVGCLVAFLASTHKAQVTLPRCDKNVTRYFQMSPSGQSHPCEESLAMLGREVLSGPRVRWGWKLTRVTEIVRSLACWGLAGGHWSRV
jgi:hypothetical protein